VRGLKKVKEVQDSGFPVPNAQFPKSPVPAPVQRVKISSGKPKNSVSREDEMHERQDGKSASARRCFSLKKLGFLTILLIGTVLPEIGCSMTGSETTRGPLVGGPCEYRSYPGQAEIVSLAPIEGPAASVGARYDVKFRFIPDGPVDEPLGRAALERTFSLLPDRDMPPDRAFMDKFDVRPGKRLGCTLKVITQGTCTPILFDFPSLIPSDTAPR
jgi:hypothetical protein